MVENFIHKLYVLKNILYKRYWIFTGFNPKWGQILKFKVINPDLAMVRFSVYDSDTISADDFIGQNTIPLPSIGEGNSNWCNDMRQFILN